MLIVLAGIIYNILKGLNIYKIDRRDKTRDKNPVRYRTVNGVYSVPKDSVKIPEDDDKVKGVIIKIIANPYVNGLCYNPSGKIKGKIAILRSIFKQIVNVNIFRKNYNKSFGYILYKDTTLEMEDDRVVCIKYKGERVAEAVNESLAFNWEENKGFKKLLKLAARESLINSERKLQEKMERKYTGLNGRLRMHIDPDTNLMEVKWC